MIVTRKVVACLLVCVVLAASLPATAQAPPTSAAPAPPTSAAPAPTTSFKPEELDQLVAPIALHPDPLLAMVLMASTYPLEVVQAARFVKENPSLKGDQLNEKLKQQTWDDSVKSLTTFPQVLTMMNEKLDWLQKLGDAFLDQQSELMAAVQRLRARAEAEGQLKTTTQQKVIVEPAPPAAATTTVQVIQAPPTIIKIEPADPQVIYVPSYNPTVVYGAWPYPAYPPYYPYPAGYFAAGAFTFAAGVAVGSALWGNTNWGGGGGEVNINNSVQNNFSKNVNNVDTARKRAEQRPAGGSGDRSNWQHNPEHRKGVQYRDKATQQKFNKAGPANAQARDSFRGRTDQAGGAGRGSAQQGGLGQQGGRGGAGGGSAQQGGLGQQGGRGGAGGGSAQQGGLGSQQGGRDGAGGGSAQLGGGRSPQASTRQSGMGGGQTRQAGAFEGMGSGREAQSSSSRGNASRESFKQSSGGSRGAAASGGRSGGGGGGGSRGSGGGGGGRGGGGGGRR